MPSDPIDGDLPARCCAVLAGGRGERVGGQKALAQLGEGRLIDAVLEAVRSAGLEPVVIAKPGTETGGIDARILREAPEPTHPLHGVATALRELNEPLVVCPCDAPLLPASLLRALAHEPGECVVVSTELGLEPLIGRYSPVQGEALSRAAAEGVPARRAVEALDPVQITGAELARHGDPAEFLANANTPADLAAIASRLDA